MCDVSTNGTLSREYGVYPRIHYCVADRQNTHESCCTGTEAFYEPGLRGDNLGMRGVAGTKSTEARTTTKGRGRRGEYNGEATKGGSTRATQEGAQEAQNEDEHGAEATVQREARRARRHPVHRSRRWKGKRGKSGGMKIDVQGNKGEQGNGAHP